MIGDEALRDLTEEGCGLTVKIGLSLRTDTGNGDRSGVTEGMDCGTG